MHTNPELNPVQYSPVFKKASWLTIQSDSGLKNHKKINQIRADIAGHSISLNYSGSGMSKQMIQNC